MSNPPILKPTGKEPTESAQQADRRAEHEREQHRLLPFRLAEDWVVAPKERRLVLGVMLPWTALQIVREFAASKDKFLALFGPTGGGKSAAAAHWLTLAGRNPIHNGDVGDSFEFDPSCRFLSAYDLERVQTSYDKGDAATLQEAIDARALVLDDIGTEKRSVIGGLGHIVYERHRHERLTLITTNLTETLFKAKYDGTNRGEGRITSRINQLGRFRGCARPSDTWVNLPHRSGR